MVEGSRRHSDESLLPTTTAASIVVLIGPRQTVSLGSSCRRVLRRIDFSKLARKGQGGGESRLELRLIHDVIARLMHYI